MIKFKKYIWPILFLVSISVGTYYFLIYREFVSDTEKRITGIFTILGLTLGIFQFWISEVNNKIRLDYEIKYEVYKELNRAIQAISENLNIEMGKDTEINPHGLVTALLNLINQFQDAVKANDDFLFPGLQYKPGFKAVSEITSKILGRADKMRKNIEDYQKKGPNEAGLDMVTLIERMN